MDRADELTSIMVCVLPSIHSSIRLFIHSFIQIFTVNLPYASHHVGDPAMNETGSLCCFREVHILLGETDDKDGKI